MGDILIEDMKEEISNRILFHLKKSGLQTDSIDFNELVDREVGAMERPAANISINSGDYKKVTLTTYKEKCIVSIFLLVQNLRGEYARRFGVYKFITQLVKFLLLEKLGLPLQDSFKPVSFQNVTDDKFMKAGYVIYQLNMSCSYNISKGDAEINEDYGELERIVNHYFLQDPSDDGTQDIEGLVELLGFRGGNAYSIYRHSEIYGGRAGTKFEDQSVYGGKAGSTY